MLLLARAARWELLILVTSFGVVTLWKLLQTGSFAGLLRAGDGTLSPGRIQLLVLTILTSLQYLLATLHDPSHMPALPSNLVTALGGSQLVYLASKAWNTFGFKSKSSEKP
jgi:hypothetical protein